MFRPFAASSILVFAIALGGAGHTQPMSRAPAAAMAVGPMTMNFVKAAAQSDEFERREGRLAVARGATPAVKAFGQWMIRAHTQTTMALEAAIRDAGMPPPPPPPLAPDQARMMAELQATHGAAFDRLYVHQQVAAHEMAMKVMRTYVRDAPAGPIHAAAAKTIPIIQTHLNRAMQLQAQGI